MNDNCSNYTYCMDNLSKDTPQNYNISPYNYSVYNYTHNDITKINNSYKIKIIESLYSEFDLSKETNIYMFPQCTDDEIY